VYTRSTACRSPTANSVAGQASIHRSIGVYEQSKPVRVTNPCAYDRSEMRPGRLLAATLNVVIGAYLLLIANGVSIAMQEREQGWQITPLPSRPVARIIVYVTIAIALQLLSAWLLMPAAAEKGTGRFWGRYAAKVGLCVGACFVAAFVFAFLVMALLDAGVI
jgi:hypothetical protein